MEKNTFQLVKFEVTGKVQGVFFRKCTKEICDKHEVHGWVLNTPKGSVQGQLEGKVEAVAKIKHWLSHTGSTKSHIDKCEFLEEVNSDQKKFSKFVIIRKKLDVQKYIFS